MDVLVMLDEDPAQARVLAHVNSVPAPRGAESMSRDVVTLYGDPSAESLALALAAAVESRRGEPIGQEGAIRHLGVWAERGAVGDSAWRDSTTGQLVTRDLDIPLATLIGTAQAILVDCGQAIKGLLAGLRMPEWPEGTRRALMVSLHPAFALPLAADAQADSLLAAVREADGLIYDVEGD
jgi:hypothetical protein